MAQLKIQFEVTFGTRLIATAIVCGLVVGVVSELASESVTLNTYYPAPSGVYTQMVTTSNTFLSRDSGKVGIGTSAPTQKLSVTGKSYFSDSMGVGTQPGARMLTVAGDGRFTGNLKVDGASGGQALDVGADANVDGRLTLGGASPALDIPQGSIRSSQGCSLVPFSANGWTFCGGGSYATLSSGMWARDQVYATGGAENGLMYCCAR